VIYRSIYSSYIVEQKSDNEERKTYDKGVGATLRGKLYLCLRKKLLRMLRITK